MSWTASLAGRTGRGRCFGWRASATAAIAGSGHQIAGLVGQGLVERSPGQSDRRRQELALSSTGRKALRSATKAMREELAGLVADLPRPEADALARGLPEVEALLSGAAPPRRPPPPGKGPAGPRGRRHP